MPPLLKGGGPRNAVEGFTLARRRDGGAIAVEGFTPRPQARRGDVLLASREAGGRIQPTPNSTHPALAPQNTPTSARSILSAELSTKHRKSSLRPLISPHIASQLFDALCPSPFILSTMPLKPSTRHESKILTELSLRRAQSPYRALYSPFALLTYDSYRTSVLLFVSRLLFSSNSKPINVYSPESGPS